MAMTSTPLTDAAFTAETGLTPAQFGTRTARQSGFFVLGQVGAHWYLAYRSPSLGIREIRRLKD